MSATLVWSLVAAGLLVGEVLTLSLVALMLAGGALVAVALAAVGVGVPVQLLGFGAASAALLVGVRPVARRHLATPSLPNSPDRALVGQPAVVTAEVREDAGQVRVHGELWSARAGVEGDVLPAGTPVFVTAVSGVTVVVLPSDPDFRPGLPPGTDRPE